MDLEQMAGSCPALGHAAARTWLPSSTRGGTRTSSDSISRFHGDGVRYKAKLIGVDPVPDAQGEKMCWDSMMKLKGLEAAGRKQGKHKQRVWLKVSSTGLKILDERTGALLHDHERSRISSLTKDESDPRALAYIYHHQDNYSLFYIKMANQADPVLVDIREVCQSVNQETPQEPAEASTQTSPLLLLNESSAPPHGGPALEGVFSPRPDPSTVQSSQVSSSNELMEVFSIQLQEPLPSTQSSSTSQLESLEPTLSPSQILSMFPTQQLGGSAYSSPPYPPTALPLGQKGILGNQWAGPAMAPWPTMPSSMAAWGPGSPIGAHNVVTSQPGIMLGGNMPASPNTFTGFHTPLNSTHAPTGATGSMQSAPPSLDHNLLL